METILDDIIGIELPAGLVSLPPRPSVPETMREEEIFFRPSGSPVHQDNQAILIQGSRTGVPPITNVEGHAVPSGNPVSNDHPAIYHQIERRRPGLPGESETILDALSIRSSGSEAHIVRTGRPISNEHAAAILTVHERPDQAPPASLFDLIPIVDAASQVHAHHPRPSSDTQIVSAGHPVSNESSAAIMTIAEPTMDLDPGLETNEFHRHETILDTLIIQKTGDTQIIPTGKPVSNESSGAIMGILDYPDATVDIPERTNPEAIFYTAENNPVSNDRGIGMVYPRAPGFAPEPAGPNPNAILYATGTGAPISNDLHAGIIHRHDHDLIFPPASPTTLPPGTTVTNEKNVSFCPSAASVANHMGDLVIQQGGGAPIPPTPDSSSLPTEGIEPPRFFPTLNFGGDVFMAASAPQLNNPDAQILPSIGQPIYADTDHTMGGGGDTTKAPNAENVSFSGQGKLDVGCTEVQTALTGDGTKTPNADNVILTLTEQSIGNQESYAGPTDSDIAPRAPVNNRDFNDTVHGAVGKPLKRNVT